MTKRTSKQAASKTEPPAKPKKRDRLLELLRREGGSTIAEIAAALVWLPHTTRAMLTGLRKQGFTIDKVKAESGSRYSIAADPAS